MSVDGTATKRYVTRDYQINPTTGEAIVYYRFGDRAIADVANAGLCYLLGDHLSSTHAEVGTDQADLAQRRYFPFGSDRPVTGANDLSQDERYTGQWRMEAGTGNQDRRELYNYGARWYLPGVGLFTQPDTVVPDYKDPQALNRYSYGYNNPMVYTDSSGRSPILPLLAIGRVAIEALVYAIPGGDRARRNQVGGQLVAQLSDIIAQQSAAKGVESSTVAAIMRHESAAIERRTLTPLPSMMPGRVADAAETAQFLIQGDSASIGPGQMQVRFAQELEERGYVTARGSRSDRIQALLGKETSVEYVAGAARYLSDRLVGTSGFSSLSQQEQQRLVLIGYNIGWAALEESIEEYGFGRTIEIYGYDNQTLDEYLRWQSEQ